MGHNLTCMENITEMFALSVGFCGLGYWRQTNSTTTVPVAMATKFDTKTTITRLV